MQSVQPTGIVRVRDGNYCDDPDNTNSCPVIWDVQNLGTHRRAVSAEVAQEMTRLLQKVVTEETGRAAAIGRGEAGKTGTTNKAKEALLVSWRKMYK